MVGAEDAVLRWSGFPVDARPRPVVLAGPGHWFAYDFRSEPHRWATLDSRPDRRDDLPVEVSEVSARFREVHTGAPVPVLRAVRHPAQFAGDRGPLELPAWWLRRAGQDVPLVVLDPSARGHLWQPAGRPEWPGVTDVATLAVDGLTLTVPVPATAGPERVLESRTAVTVAHQPRVSTSGRLPVGFHTRTAEVRLARPLGDRVLVDPVTAWPLVVLMDHQTSRTPA